MRINKFIAQQSGVSRREADDLIESGKVSINGETARIGQGVAPKDTVLLNGEAVTHVSHPVYIMLNKPVGYVSSRAQQDTHPTLYSLLADDLQQLKTVGRLDKDSSGLIILTNDGDFAFRYTHPKFVKEKRYEVTVSKPLAQGDISLIESGVKLKDGISKLGIKATEKPNTYIVIMSEGRNRQIRRTFGALGYDLLSLHRTQMGEFTLGNLAPGKTVPVTPSSK